MGNDLGGLHEGMSLHDSGGVDVILILAKIVAHGLGSYMSLGGHLAEGQGSHGRRALAVDEPNVMTEELT